MPPCRPPAHPPAGQPTPSDWGQARCIGYAGPRKQVLVVDNEEADRSLLQRWLAPLGFDVVLATSGHDALRLLGEGLPTGTGMRPHAVFMDLAMPGIDGWETLRRLSAMGLRSGPQAMACAVVSANAFDHGQDNDVGIAPADFFVEACAPPAVARLAGATPVARLDLARSRPHPSYPRCPLPSLTWPSGPMPPACTPCCAPYSRATCVGCSVSSMHWPVLIRSRGPLCRMPGRCCKTSGWMNLNAG